MKVLYCTDCGDIFAPLSENMSPRHCSCGRHAIWWRDGARGLASAWDREGRFDAAWILGITNAFLCFPGSGNAHMTADDITRIVDSHGPSYLFKQQRSCIVRIRPGSSGDTLWQELPP